MALLACVEEGRLGFVLVWKEFTRKLSRSSHDLKVEINHHAELPCTGCRSNPYRVPTTSAVVFSACSRKERMEINRELMSVQSRGLQLVGDLLHAEDDALVVPCHGLQLTTCKC
jgi:hypothetical protein